MSQVKVLGKTYSVDKLPDECPYCHKSITPIVIGENSWIDGRRNYLELILRCPNLSCNRASIGYYEYLPEMGGNVLYGCNTGNPREKSFSEEIKSISPTFVQVYNEAYFAEQHKLFEICGVGYRKALEFLIKDYLIKQTPSKEDVIKKKFLGKCIQEDVSDQRIKSVSKRAVWLGNDETHYVKNWEGHDLEDLKRLIDLTRHWIEMEELTKSFNEKMPD